VAKRQAQLVEEIRAKRQGLRRSFAELFDPKELEEHIRNEPLPWLLGGAVAGLVVAGLAAGPLVRQSRSAAGSWVRAGVRDAMVDAVLAAVSRTGQGGAGQAEPREADPHAQAATLIDPVTIPPE
jgi:AcrR family transcriptional regulator